MITPDPLADLRAAIQRLDDTRQDVFCHPDLAEQVRAIIDDYGVGGIYTVRPCSILPLDLICLMKPTASVMRRHWLVVEGPGVSHVEHVGCTTRPSRWSSPGHEVLGHDCEIESYLTELGEEAFAEPIPDEPGRYEIRAWSSRTQVNYGTGVEFDGGIEFVPDDEGGLP